MSNNDNLDANNNTETDKNLESFTQIKSKLIKATKPNENIQKWPMIRSWFFESIVNYYSLDMSFVFSKALDAKKMEEALSQTLNHYLALSGRVHYKGLYEDQYILMNNQGAEMIQRHQPNVGYMDLIDGNREQTMIRGRYCKILNGETIIHGEAPLLTLQLTYLERGGCVLGVCISHCIVDGGAFSMFMQDLSKCYQDQMDIKAVEKPIDLYSRMSSSMEEINHAVKVLKFNQLSTLKSFALRYMYSWAFYFLRKQKAVYPNHCPPRFCLSFSKKELEYIKHVGMNETKKNSKQNWVSTNEALVVHIWTMLLDVCELPDEQRSDLGISVIVNPRGRSKYVPERVLGSIGFGVHYAIDMSSKPKDKNKYTQIHELFRWAVSDEVVNASITMLESGMSRNRFDPIFVNSRTSSELPYGLSRWNLNPQTLVEGNVFGLSMNDLVGAQSWNTGEVYKVVMRVDGGCDAYINQSQNPVMGNMVSNWPLVRLMGQSEYFKRLSAYHEQFQKKVACEYKPDES